MYDSFLNKEVCKKEGMLIYNDGGVRAMVACYYIMATYTNYELLRELENHWDGVGSWQASTWRNGYYCPKN